MQASGDKLHTDPSATLTRLPPSPAPPQKMLLGETGGGNRGEPKKACHIARPLKSESENRIVRILVKEKRKTCRHVKI